MDALNRALYQGKALRQQKVQARWMAIVRAVDDVLDGTCSSAADAARGRGVSEEAVRAELRRRRAMSDPHGRPTS